MPQRPPLLAKVTVAESAYDEAYPDALHIAVADFVSLALQAEYRPEELPEEAVRSYWLSEYIGTVANGGHATLVANWEFPPAMRRHVRTALAALALPEHQAIFADMEAFARRHPVRLQRCHGGGEDEIDPYFYELDARYGAQPRDAVMHAQRAWLLTRGWIEVLPDRAMAALSGRLVPPHPQAQARRAARIDPSILDTLRGLLRRH